MTDDTCRPVFVTLLITVLRFCGSHLSVSHSRFSEVEVPVNKEKKNVNYVTVRRINVISAAWQNWKANTDTMSHPSL